MTRIATSNEVRRKLIDALLPFVVGSDALAVKVLYVTTGDGLTADVCTLEIAVNGKAMDALDTAAQEEIKLRALPHAEHSFSIVQKRPTHR